MNGSAKKGQQDLPAISHGLIDLLNRGAALVCVELLYTGEDVSRGQMHSFGRTLMDDAIPSGTGLKIYRYLDNIDSVNFVYQGDPKSLLIPLELIKRHHHD